MRVTIRTITVVVVMYVLSTTKTFASDESIATTLKEIEAKDISIETRVELLEQAYQSAQARKELASTGNVLFEIASIYLELGDDENYEKYRQFYLTFFKEQKDPTTRLLLKLLGVEKKLRDVQHQAVIEQGAELEQLLDPATLSKKRRIQDSVYEFTLNEFIKLINFIGIAHFSLGEYEQAHQYFTRAMKHSVELNDLDEVASLLGNLSAVSWSQNDFEKALEYTERAIEVLEKTGNVKTLLRSRYNKAVYLVELERFTEAKNLLLGLVHSDHAISYPDLKISIILSLTSILVEEKAHEQAEHYLDIAEELALVSGDSMSLNDIHRQLAELKISEGDYSNAIAMLKKTENFYQERSLKRDLADNYKILSKVYRSMDQLDDAIKYLDSYYTMMLDLQSEARQKSVLEYQEKYEAERLERENISLKSEVAYNALQVKSRNIFIFALLAISILIIGLIWLQLRNKKALALQYETMSLTDPLTKIGNRRYFKLEMQRELAFVNRAQVKGDDIPIAVFILDIDHFKQLNDTQGHDVGDAILVRFAARIKATLRTTDIFARWGGEEFIAVARIQTNEDIDIVASRVLTAINSKPFDVLGVQCSVTCSIGGVSFPIFRGARQEADWQTLVNLADQALYYAKNNGRDQWVIINRMQYDTIDDYKLDAADTMNQLVERGKISLRGSKQLGAD